MDLLTIQVPALYPRDRAVGPTQVGATLNLSSILLILWYNQTSARFSINFGEDSVARIAFPSVH